MGTLSIRRTNKYVDSYSCLDDWEDIGEFKTLWRNREDKSDDDGYDHWVTEYLFEVSSDRGVEEIVQALKNQFTHWGCAHEYDCCGCPLLSVKSISAVSENRYYLVQTGTRNY